MKRKILIKKLESNGWIFVRHGKEHDIYRKGDKQETIPRHTEIAEPLAKAILTRAGLIIK